MAEKGVGMNPEHRARLVSYAEAYAKKCLPLADSYDTDVCEAIRGVTKDWADTHEKAGDSEAAEACRKTMAEIAVGADGAYGWRALERVFLGRWGASGRPTLIPADVHWAAAMCATNVSKEILSMVAPPWPALMVEIPPELGLAKRFDDVDRAYVSDKGLGDLAPRDYEITTLALLVHRMRPGLDVLPGRGSDGRWVSTLAYGAAPLRGVWDLPYYRTCKLEELGDDLEMLEEGHDDKYLRTQKIIGKIVLGCLLAMQGGQSHATSARSKERRRRGGKLPSEVEFVVGEPVHVRTVDYVRDFIAGGRRKARGGSVFVQRLIAGHWKNQPCGAGSKERKFIHIEPYWRGPEDAPIAVSPHILKPPPKKPGDSNNGAPPQAAE